MSDQELPDQEASVDSEIIEPVTASAQQPVDEPAEELAIDLTIDEQHVEERADDSRRADEPIDDSTVDSTGDDAASAFHPTIGLAEARRAVEAMLMVADQPVPTATIAQLLELPTATVQELCTEMAADFEALGHGFQLVMVAGGWRFQSHPAQAQYVERFVLDGQVSRLSAAALETLAIVAYKQPISRAQIAQIRGVNVDGVMRTLTQRGYVAEIGTDPGPGQASLFGTTTKFLEGVGMGSIADLAPLADFVPGAEIMEALEAGLRVDTTIDASLDGPNDVPASTVIDPVQSVSTHDPVG